MTGGAPNGAGERPARRSPVLDVPDRELLDRLAVVPAIGGVRLADAVRGTHVDVYLDTRDGALARHHAACRIRSRPGALPQLTLAVGVLADGAPWDAGGRWEEPLPSADVRQLSRATGPAAQRLTMLVDLALLEVVTTLHVTRRRRAHRPRWLGAAEMDVTFDEVTARVGGVARSYFEVVGRQRVAGAGDPLGELLAAVRREHGLHPVLEDRRTRGTILARAARDDAAAVRAGRPRVVVVVHTVDGRIACEWRDGGLRLPTADGGGADVCRALTRREFGGTRDAPRLVGVVAAAEHRPLIEVWRTASDRADGTHHWLAPEALMARAGAPALRDECALLALDAWRADDGPDDGADLMPRDAAASARGAPPDIENTARGVESAHPGAATRTRTTHPSADGAPLSPPHPAPARLSADLSLLEFNARIVAMADDPALPVAERVRLLGIAGANLDEFFMGRVEGLKRAARRRGELLEPDALSPAAQRAAVTLRAAALGARQARAAHRHLDALARHGVRVVTWHSLSAAAREGLRAHLREDVLPHVDLLGITLSPGHPFPRPPHLTLSLAVLGRDTRTGVWYLSPLDLPRELPRYLHVPGTADLIAVEDVLRANLGDLDPDRDVQAVFAYRVTRGGDIDVAPDDRGNLSRAIDDATRRRPFNQVVRVEFERGVPHAARAMILAELSLEPGVERSDLTPQDVYEADGPLGLRDLVSLAAEAPAGLGFAPFRGRPALAPGASLWARLREGALLAHHPYDDFGVVERFFVDAADDPDVVALCATLYRTGEPSAIVDALLRAHAAGKRVVACVELRARFDERRNLTSARRLEEAGVRVVHGLGALKVHAKAALVERREDGGVVRRYAHVGTGNYNAQTARFYGDFSLLTADPAVGADLAALFEALVSPAEAPPALTRCLASPWTLLPALLDRIAREVSHARAGRGGLIRLKLNGLSDAELVDALLAAAQAGVDVHLVVRGICTLRPGVPGLSDRVRVVSTMGRFLEHGRIYHFANAGAPEYFIGSADWRARNVRQRVELVAPVTDPAHHTRLAAILDTELADPTAWELRPDGTYARREGWEKGVGAQVTFGEY